MEPSAGAAGTSVTLVFDELAALHGVGGGGSVVRAAAAGAVEVDAAAGCVCRLTIDDRPLKTATLSASE
jgi:hypothetical protein